MSSISLLSLLVLQTFLEQNPMPDIPRIMIQSKFLPTPIIPPNLVIKVLVLICSSETVFSTTLPNDIVIPLFSSSLNPEVRILMILKMKNSQNLYHWRRTVWSCRELGRNLHFFVQKLFHWPFWRILQTFLVYFLLDTTWSCQRWAREEHNQDTAQFLCLHLN